ncbi:ROK family transcriptional regulator [Paenibacillus agaridevorans]|uniref:ROK family transcriptional regulator n=1 Tax=Paenibacillus agaridevorans TaxID=171404 RepID=A0A2R5EH03_9BACL|nr:ROK family transcriptional regulator [Paenibacillus agaridevorans]GBG05852.1 ROK family transcriptional regulator [Paenibacillus agaridevorans]
MKKANSANPSLIRDINRTSVLDVMRRTGPISQADIAKILALQPSTIMRIVTELLEERLIVSVGQGKTTSKGGRKATLLELNKDGAYAIGVDLNADEVIAVLLDLGGVIVAEVRTDCPSESGPNHVMDTVKQSIEALLAQSIVSADRMIGIGVSVPGKVDSVTGTSVMAINFRDWFNVPIGEQLEQAFQLPVYVEHDMRSMAFGEMWFGNEYDHMLCLGFRSGIGLGLVLNGELYRGAHQLAGDVGHMIVDPDGPPCSCGRKGCLEAVASEKALHNNVRRYVQQHSLSSADKLTITMEELNIRFIYETFLQGHPDITAMIKEAADYIGKTLCDLIRVYDPQAIVIGGNVLASSSEFLDLVRSAYQSMQPNYADDIPSIQPARFGEQSIAIGSASLMLSRLFKPNGV